MSEIETFAEKQTRVGEEAVAALNAGQFSWYTLTYSSGLTHKLLLAECEAGLLRDALNKPDLDSIWLDGAGYVSFQNLKSVLDGRGQVARANSILKAERRASEEKRERGELDAEKLLAEATGKRPT